MQAKRLSLTVLCALLLSLVIPAVANGHGQMFWAKVTTDGPLRPGVQKVKVEVFTESGQPAWMAHDAYVAAVRAEGDVSFP